MLHRLENALEDAVAGGGAGLAVLLRIQALLLPIKTLVLSGH